MGLRYLIARQWVSILSFLASVRQPTSPYHFNKFKLAGMSSMARSRSLAASGIAILTNPGAVSDGGASSDLFWRSPRFSVNVFIYPFNYLFALYCCSNFTAILSPEYGNCFTFNSARNSDTPYLSRQNGRTYGKVEEFSC